MAFCRCFSRGWNDSSFSHGKPVGHDYPGKGNVGPKEAAQFCINHPEAKVIFAHFGGGLWLYELMPEMKKYLQNARYDTAALPWLYQPQIFQAIIGAGILEKMFYGSDFPILSFERYKKIFNQIFGEKEGVDNLLGENAAKFLLSRC
ncbi:amidohydrolase family protein [Aminobacterium mobile]|uniref:amidohydrolase family protein n=1 Tax=Aminobacterium mobile TaxID=81467 RepID=UPI002FDA00A1